MRPISEMIAECQASLMIDTGSLPEHAEALLKWSRQVLRRPITQAVAPHAAIR